MNQYQTVTGTETVLRDGTIKLHGPDGFAGMRAAGTLAAEILDALVGLGFCASRGEAKRKIAEGAVKVDDNVVSAADAVVTVSDDIKLSLGKKRHGP